MKLVFGTEQSIRYKKNYEKSLKIKLIKTYFKRSLKKPKCAWCRVKADMRVIDTAGGLVRVFCPACKKFTIVKSNGSSTSFVELPTKKG